MKTFLIRLSATVLILFACVSCKTNVDTKPQNFTYHVNHYLQKIDGDGYSLDYSELLKGESGSLTKVVERRYSGFHLKNPIVQKKLVSESVYVDVYYDRNEITIILDLDGGYFVNPEQKTVISGLYGAPVGVIPPPEKENSVFVEWNPVVVNFPLQDTICVAIWNDLIPYSVKYLCENFYGEYEETDSKTEYVNSGDYANFVPESIPGFECLNPNAVVNQPVSDDGSTVFEYYFNRKEITIKIKSESDEWYLIGKYGETVNSEPRKYKGKKFVRYEPAMPETFPSESGLEFTAVYKDFPEETKYLVKYYLDGFYDSAEEKTGLSGEYTDVEEKSFPGFELVSEIEQKKIDIDGSTVVEVYYKRKFINTNLEVTLPSDAAENDYLYLSAYGSCIIKRSNSSRTYENFKWYLDGQEIDKSGINDVRNYQLTVYNLFYGEHMVLFTGYYEGEFYSFSLKFNWSKK